jgi:hypothetical protein
MAAYLAVESKLESPRLGFGVNELWKARDNEGRETGRSQG